jgi:hypothetical protein
VAIAHFSDGATSSASISNEVRLSPSGSPTTGSAGGRGRQRGCPCREIRRRSRPGHAGR